MTLCNLLLQGIYGCSAIFIQKLHMLRFLKERLLLVLRVHIYEKRRYLPELCGGHRHIIYSVDGSGIIYSPRDEYLAILRWLHSQISDLLNHLGIIHQEKQLTEALLVRLPDYILRKLISHTNLQGSHDYGLTCTGLTGKYVEIIGKINICIVYECNILDMYIK